MEVFLKLLTVLACLSQCFATVVQVGDKLGAGSSWKSPGGTFAIGLRPTQPGGSSDFELSIWYECEAVDIDQKTVVWTAKTTNALPVRVSKNSQLQLTTKGLTVFEGHPDNLQWQSPSSQCCVQSGYMSESGNFIINYTNTQSWESFHLPTNTLLPNQQLVRSSGVNSTVLSSNSGSYTLNLKMAQVFLRSGYMSYKYWSISKPLHIHESRTGINDDNGELTNQPNCVSDRSLTFTPTLNLSSDGVLKFYDGSGKTWHKSQTENNQRYATDYGKNVLRRVTLGDDGNFRMFSLAETNKTWSVVWQALLKECDVFGTCGPFGYCMYRPHKTCTCPPGFHKVDPADDSKGCDYDSPIACDGSDVKLVQVNRADYYYNDYNFARVTTLDECKSTCLNDCECRAVAYKYNGFGLCFHKGKSDKLYNGAQSFDLNNIMFMKVRKELPLTDDANDLFVSDSNATLTRQDLFTKHSVNAAQKVILSIALVQFVIIASAAVVSWICWHRNLQRIGEEMAEEIHGGPTRFSYMELQEVTSNFEEKLGSGGFGTVYKGESPSEGGTVAVKVIEAATQTEKQFKAEVNTIGRVHHVNLVRLLGYCAEGSHRMLVYEYMPNGSLDKVLFEENLDCAAHYDWNTRYSIALGVAKGISYLHEECQECIIHCDIKPQNVLLDEYFHPKISDFGLAKLVKKEHAFSISTVRGTRGYVAPEWLHNQPVTAKADVYSFGMLVLDILSGRTKLKITSSALETNEWYFPLWAFHKFMSTDLKSIADPKLQNEVQWEEFERLLKVAFWCSQPDAESRPSMSRVVQMLEGNVQVPEPIFPELEGDRFITFSAMEASRATPEL